MTEGEALKLALEYVEIVPDDRYNAEHIDREALVTAIKEALAQPPLTENGIYQLGYHNGYGFGEAYAKKQMAQPEQEPKCNPHPRAPHGFNRNASHSNDRYTCECEGWDAYEAGYQDGLQKGFETEPEQDWSMLEAMQGSLREHMARIKELEAQRKSLTDEEITNVIVEMNGNEPTALFWRDLTRAIEAKLKEKNT